MNEKPRGPQAQRDSASNRETIEFEIPVQIESGDIDTLGHVNNLVYLRWVLEAAAAHWNDRATEVQKAEYTWVVLRHEIDYLRPAVPGDALVARTRVGAIAGAKFDRHVEIYRLSEEAPLARARTVWVALDPKSGRPRRVGEGLKERFYAEESV